MPFEQFVIFFLLMLTGFFCSKYGVFTTQAVNGINKFVVYFAYPSVILVKTAALNMEPYIFANFMLVIVVSAGIFLLLGLYARFYLSGKRFEGVDRPTAELAVAVPNNGFMGLPIAITFFGDLGLLYMIANNIAMNFFFFTYGITVLKRGRDMPGESLAKKLLKMIGNPNVSATIAGVILCYYNIRLPGLAVEFLEVVGAVATPMAMISIGTMLVGNLSWKTFKKRAVIETTVSKLFIVPLITAAIVWFLPFDPLVKIILIAANVLPTAAYVSIMSEQYGRDKHLASEIVVVSTLFSMATVPFAIWLLGRSSIGI